MITNNLEAAQTKAELKVLKKELGITDNRIMVGEESVPVKLIFFSGVSQTGEPNEKYVLKIASKDTTITATSADLLKKALEETLIDLVKEPKKDEAPAVTGAVVDGNPVIELEVEVPSLGPTGTNGHVGTQGVPVPTVKPKRIRKK